MRTHKLVTSVTFVLLLLVLVGCSQIDESDSLIAHWTFDEGTGEHIQEQVSSEQQHITYVFNEQNQPLLYKPASNPLWKEEGVVDGALLFDGYSTYIETEDFTMPSDTLTISAWVAPRAFEWGDQGLLSAFVSQANKQSKQGIVFGMYRHGTWGLQLGLGNDLISEWVEIWDDGHPLPKYEWSHVTATYNAEEGKATLYLNGEKINEQVFEQHVGKPIRISNEVLTIGKHNNNTRVVGVFDVNMFNGIMDELRIYNTDLSDEEVADLFRGDLASYGDNIPAIDYETIRIDPNIYAGDRYRPQFHAIPPGHWMNEPHAPLYYNGKYHLFYQHNPFGPFWHQIHWGHWVSDDMIHWENVKEAISPEADDLSPDGIWSGSATLDHDGNPVIFTTAGNDSASPNQRVALYKPVDLNDPYLLEWEAHPEPVIVQEQGQGDFGEFRDPFVWKDEHKDVWYLLNGSGTNNNNGGTALIYSSTDLYNWEYHGNVYESDYSKYKFLGEHWELPVLLPVQSEDGSIQKQIFMISPHGAGANVEVYYWLGQFDTETMRFIPEHEEPRLLDYGGGFFTGPSGFVDPKTGRTIVFTIAQGLNRNSWEDYYSGWAHTVGMPVSLYLDGQTGELRFAPIEEVENARKATLLSISDTTLEEANAMLSDIQGDTLQIIVKAEVPADSEFGIKVRRDPNDLEFASIAYDEAQKQLSLDRLNSSLEKSGLGIRHATLELENGEIALNIVLDRSLLEIYVNDEVSMTSRLYPTLGTSMGVALFGTESDITIKQLDVYEMGSVYTSETVPPYYEH